MEDKLKKVMASVFGIEEAAIDDDASPDTIEQWDSLRHLNLVLALEEEFKIKFSDEEIGEILNYKLILLTLRDKLNDK